MSVGLVLEGGGTRGAYTSGVLDVLLEEKISFPSVYGISAERATRSAFWRASMGAILKSFTTISATSGI